MICTRCAGSGLKRTNGNTFEDCKDCNKSGRIADAVVKVTIDKRSKEYKTAINEIMNLNDKISREEAVKIFDETVDNV
jgi:hypothetical protein